MRLLGFEIIQSDIFPGDAFMMFGATRWRDGHQEQHVVAYRNGSVTERWMRTSIEMQPQPRKAPRDDE